MGFAYQQGGVVISFIFRFRVLIVFSSIIACLAILSYANLYFKSYPSGWFGLVDISFWVLFFGSLIAGCIDVLVFWRRAPLLSTLLLTVIGISVVFTFRVFTVIYSLLKYMFNMKVFGGSVVDDVSYKVGLIAILGSFLLLASTLISTAYGRHVVFRESPTLYSTLIWVARVLSGIELKVLYITSFLVGFTTRLYPELKYPDLPIGWDTLEFIAVARDFSQAENPNNIPVGVVEEPPTTTNLDSRPPIICRLRPLAFLQNIPTHHSGNYISYNSSYSL